MRGQSTVDVPRETAEQSRIYVRFIDILFAVVLAQSFVFLTATERLPTWLASPEVYVLPLANTVLAYTVVVTSWVGYHQSVAKVPIASIWRFLIDIWLLFLYYLAFVSVESLPLMLLILFLIFFSYFAWTIARIREYWQERSSWNFERRVLHALAFSIAFGALWYLDFELILPDPVKGLLLGGVFALLILYRWINRGGPSKTST